ncbi:hypothetical protein QUB80_08310 [Chlorogloeopsis sp. ULAP01]|uniref:hypothetical protein n=1 Tax=Chlorogloeopsis sp. ULAP01 TaxID=3056483 RepID=UPI0025AAC69E|nr:hypothetical protein [Chlorogloeopsis sp. ULAP01]MDM9380707.1 hypothetical protein [Chlorogloeopsis sp. ULAP01]
MVSGEPAPREGFQRTVPTTGGTLRSRPNGGNPRTALLLATDCPPPQVTGVDAEGGFS